MTISKYSLLIPILNDKGELKSDFSVSAILICCLNLGHSSATRRKTINSISLIILIRNFQLFYIIDYFL